MQRFNSTHQISNSHHISSAHISRKARVRTPGPKAVRVDREWRTSDWATPRDDVTIDARNHGRFAVTERHDRAVARSPSSVKERRWSASIGGQNKKWKSTNSSFDVFDKLMVRAERGGKMGRQLSLDGPARPVLRRQTSEDLRPGPLKIAWAADDVQPSVELVAKKCGQPKPSTVKPPRSPYHSDETAAVVYSRQQLTERLRTSWKKSSGRHNLNIFINQSVESETDSVSEAVDSPLESDAEADGDGAFRDPAPEPALKDRDKGVSACASDRRLAFRMMGRQSKIIDSPCSTPEPGKGGAAPPVRRMMSAPSRPPSKKLTKAATVESRVKSAPSKRKHKPPQPRRKAKGDSSDDEKSGTRRVKRGVENREIVTMVSLVSPAESEEEEAPAPTPDLKRPPTPKPPPESPRPNPPPPPPILSLRKPSKAVSFRPVVQPQPSSTQYQTTFPLKRTLTHQNTTGPSGVGGRPPFQRQATLPPSSSPSPVPSAPRPATAPRPPPAATKATGPACIPDPQDDQPDDHPAAVVRDHPSAAAKDHPAAAKDHPAAAKDHQIDGSQRPPTSVRVQRKPSIAHHPPSTVRRKVIQATHSVIKLEPEPTKEAELPLPIASGTTKKPEVEEISHELEVEVSEKPVFKNPKEKECWALFKKMSDRGVSVSFETVLRGLLTPTEYRMRRAALMSVC